MRALVQTPLLVALALVALVRADLVAVTPEGQALLDSGMAMVMGWVETAGATLDETVAPIPAGQ